jgi:hypothetical protein
MNAVQSQILTLKRIEEQILKKSCESVPLIKKKN